MNALVTLPDAIQARIKTIVLDHYIPTIADDQRAYRFREVGADEIADRGMVPLAARTLELVSHDLGLRDVKLRWFAKLDKFDEQDRASWQRQGYREWSSASDCGGIVFGNTPDTIWISIHHSRVDTVRSIVHELRHLWQDATWGQNKNLNDRDRLAEELRREMDAYAYTWQLERMARGG